MTQNEEINDLFARHAAEAGRYLPARGRDDIEREIAATLADRLDDRTLPGQTATLDDAAALLDQPLLSLTRGNVHRCPEVVNALVQRHRNARSMVDVKTAMTASPMVFTKAPPCARGTARFPAPHWRSRGDSLDRKPSPVIR